MTFRYFSLADPDDRDRPVGLFAVSRDKEAGRLDTVSYSYLDHRWIFDPGVTRYLFTEAMDEATEVSRERAQQIAQGLGIPFPSEAEMMAITDEAERQAAQRRGDGTAR